MLEIVVIISCVITLIILKICLNINFKKIKKMKITSNESLKEISNTFDSDEQICRKLLKKVKKEDVKIKIEPEYNNSLYTIFNNTITIGKFREKYMKPQTIAHECVHASQNKITLWSNFVFTNIYLVYFFIITILAIFNKLPNTNIYLIILIFVSFIQYIIRFNLENEAMLKAKFLAKEYLEENELLNKEQKDILLEEYDKVNKIGIPFMNYYLINMNIVKIIIFAIVHLI